MTMIAVSWQICFPWSADPKAALTRDDIYDFASGGSLRGKMKKVCTTPSSFRKLNSNPDNCSRMDRLLEHADFRQRTVQFHGQRFFLRTPLR